MAKVIYIRKRLTGDLLTISKGEFMNIIVESIATGLCVVLEQ